MSGADDLTHAMTETALWLGQSRADGVPRADAVEGMRKARSPKLTAAQRRRVRELMDDEGESRASAIAWVLGMEPKGGE